MKKNLLIVTLLMVTSFVFAQQRDGMVTIKGTLNGDLKGNDVIYMYTRTSNDSTKIINKQYTFTFPFKEVGLKFLYPKYIQAMRQVYQPFGILISGPGTYYVVSDIAKGMNASELKGSEPMVFYHRYQDDEKLAYKSVNPALEKLYGAKWWQVEDKDPQYASIQKSADSLKTVFILPVIEKLVKEHPGSFASAYVLSGSGKGIGSVEEKEKLYNHLTKNVKESVAAKDFRDYIQGLKNSSVGASVAAFTLPDPAGKDVDFKTLKGKYVLIDFWASWCYPCRKSFPHMREVYKKYKSDQFEIYSVSIDEDKNAWLKAVKEENNPWLQSLDTKNVSQKGFAVTAVPSTFLIDPQGKIIAKEVGFDTNGEGEIEKKIKEIFSDTKRESVPMIPMSSLN